MWPCHSEYRETASVERTISLLDCLTAPATISKIDKYDAIWLSVPAYHDLTPKNKSYDEVSQWNGKKMNELNRHLLGVVTQSL